MRGLFKYWKDFARKAPAPPENRKNETRATRQKNIFDELYADPEKARVLPRRDDRPCRAFNFEALADKFDVSRLSQACAMSAARLDCSASKLPKKHPHIECITLDLPTGRGL